MSYAQHYDLMARLEGSARLIESPELYNFIDAAIYAAHMDMLAQPLPNGEDSPFSSRDPGSGHGLLMSVITHLQKVHSNEFNLTPDVVWINWFRILGAEVLPAEYPIINLTFRRTQPAVENGITVTINRNTPIVSSLDPSIVAYTLYEDSIEGNDESVTIPARLNRLGRYKLSRKEFTVLPRLLSYVQEVENEEAFVSSGRNSESLAEAMVRIRDGIRAGTLGRQLIDGEIDPTNPAFMGRCVTLPDFYFWAQQTGATKVNVLSGIQYGTQGTFGDLITMVVYPPDVADLAYNLISPMVVLPKRFDVRAAEIIPIDGMVTVKIRDDILPSSVFNLVASAIVAEVNPPYGKWGDLDFRNTLATGLEKAPGIYAVPFMELKHSETNVPLDELDIQPWNLLEIQQSLEIRWER